MAESTQLFQGKIFLIGFNKCGTTSLHSFFERNSIPSVHWGHNQLAVQIYKNKHLNQPLLTGIDQYTAYSDMEAVIGQGSHPRLLLFAHREFKLLDQHYGNSLFILNTRDQNDWIRSRLKHANGAYAQVYLQKLRIMTGNPTITMEQMVNYWKREWIHHHHETSLHFKDCNRFLTFHIQSDPPSLLSSFLLGHGVPIKDPTIPHDRAIGKIVSSKKAHP